MATLDTDTNDEMEFVRYEIDRICKLLDLEKPEIIELKKVGSLSPVPKLSRDGKRIVLYKRRYDNYTWPFIFKNQYLFFNRISFNFC